MGQLSLDSASSLLTIPCHITEHSSFISRPLSCDVFISSLKINLASQILPLAFLSFELLVSISAVTNSPSSSEAYGTKHVFLAYFTLCED